MSFELRWLIWILMPFMILFMMDFYFPFSWVPLTFCSTKIWIRLTRQIRRIIGRMQNQYFFFHDVIMSTCKLNNKFNPFVNLWSVNFYRLKTVRNVCAWPLQVRKTNRCVLVAIQRSVRSKKNGNMNSLSFYFCFHFEARVN